MKSADLDLSKISAKILPGLKKIQKYWVFILFLIVSCVFGFLVFQINSLSSAEPTEDQLNEKLSNIKQPKIDKKAADTIKQLQSSNVEIKALFDQARDNPFQDN